jgi:hypothetical protein
VPLIFFTQFVRHSFLHLRMDAALHALLTYRKYSINRCRMHFEAINLLQSAVTYFSRIYLQTDRQTDRQNLRFWSIVLISTQYFQIFTVRWAMFSTCGPTRRHPWMPFGREPDGHIPLNLTVATVQSGMWVPCPSSR